MSLIERFKRFFKKSIKVKRVFSYSDLVLKGNSTNWNTINIDDKPELMDKVLNHLKTAIDYRVYVSTGCVECSCYTKKFGYVKCVFHHNFIFFEFGVYKNNTRYKIPYAIMNNKEFKDFLQSTFGDVIKEYKEDKNL